MFPFAPARKLAMKCYSAIVLAVTCQMVLASVLPLDDPLQCPLHCECNANDADVLLKCDGVQSEDPMSLVSDLAGQMEGLVSVLDVSRSRIPTLGESAVVGKRNFSLLRTLKLRECEIEKIELKAFKSASSLEEVGLTINHFYKETAF